MSHVVLLGDSIFDNAAYIPGQPDVIAHVRRELPAGWHGSLRAIDGSTTADVPAQLATLPLDATHLVLSVGGNDALLCADVLETRVGKSAEALLLFADVAERFETAYRRAVSACLSRRLPLVLCTIYNGNFADEDYQRVTTIALTVFNDAILRLAVEHRLTVIDLRQVCNTPADYANPIEPSSAGGAKIARAVVRAVTQVGTVQGANVVAS